MVLNEPENSLHPDLIPALARLIALAAENSQVIVVSHNAAVVEELGQEFTASQPIGRLISEGGWHYRSLDVGLASVRIGAMV